MKIEFWSVKQLQKEFDVIASFYQIELGNKIYLCRNQAFIFRKGYTKQNEPDAVIVMANPGSCCPKDTSFQPPFLHDHFNNAPYVEVKADPTQLQLMRLMKIMNWNVISIINLSDLCTGNMADFKEKLKLIEECTYKEHSIFSDNRETERALLLNGGKSKIIIAWVKNSIIRKLACETTVHLSKEIFGLQYKSPKWGFRHPFPLVKEKCLVWLEDMYQHLNYSDAQTEIASSNMIINDERLVCIIHK